VSAMRVAVIVVLVWLDEIIVFVTVRVHVIST
jgi:hypothetical protein